MTPVTAPQTPLASRGDFSRLNAATRALALASMRSRVLDVLVIGGGIVGAGSALDAVTRGLDVGILEAQDWASGTSSRSSKLVHGGIRYLEQLDFPLVQEALTERGLLLQSIAPHLVRPIRFLYPLHHRLWERVYIGAGMMLYDLLSYTGGRTPGVPHHRHLSKRQVALAAPSLRSSNIIGGLSYYDGQVDDARYVVTLVRTAASFGAHAANRVRVEGFLTEGERIVGVKAHDLLTDEHFEIRAKSVINSTGVWTGETQAMVADGGRLRVRASKGVHILIPRAKFQSIMGLLLRTEKSVLFVIPWGKHWIIGTTDTDWHLDKVHPSATAADIDYLLEHVNTVMETPLTRDDIEGVYVGLRPLLAGESDETSKLSREHVVANPAPGLTLIAGGKWTTYRVMAQDAVDAAVDGLDGLIPPSITDRVPLLGACGYVAEFSRRERTAAETGLSVALVTHLLHRYGSMAPDVLALIAENASLATLVPGTTDYVQAEVIYAATHEGALHIEDVLDRRTRLAIETSDRGAAAAPVVAKLLAPVLGWNATRAKAEVANYLAWVEAELASQRQDDDVAANALSVAVPPIGLATTL
ncbi:glycerol-3-phosphate dehydrogenase/oxidase [Alpinimonas psychrophila]|uniref:Glycerol-3-phosphate dehydrogenase n=2 Tax=Alpinimonas psychrophila TaxID=748908 RepID=A0A7W3PQ34_9MICO|nr:glycerol-3-phosphate dehydrogenase [Alpinimonas psychrophila]